ncbi:MAG: hypothetical protein MRY59_04315 [Aquisalinus sp.]|nr:hypothetical protein [Aquisalinus sp.]
MGTKDTKKNLSRLKHILERRSDTANRQLQRVIQQYQDKEADIAHKRSKLSQLEQTQTRSYQSHYNQPAQEVIREQENWQRYISLLKEEHEQHLGELSDLESELSELARKKKKLAWFLKKKSMAADHTGEAIKTATTKRKRADANRRSEDHLERQSGQYRSVDQKNA